jgi:hypothetical protein
MPTVIFTYCTVVLWYYPYEQYFLLLAHDICEVKPMYHDC